MKQYLSKIKKNKTVKNRDVNILSNDNRYILSQFFDENFYLSFYSDVQKAQIDGISHFIEYGFREGRIPTTLLNLSYLNFLSAHNIQYSENMLSDILKYIEGIRNWPTKSLFGPSALVCPAWLVQQVEADPNINFLELLNKVVPVGLFTPHPGMSAYEVKQPTTIKKILENLNQNDFQNLSLVDLGNYINNYKDLESLNGNFIESFNHLWTNGYIENRLNYLGNRQFNNIDLEKSFYIQLETAYYNKVDIQSLLSSKKEKCLSPHNIECIDSNSSTLLSLNALINNHISKSLEYCSIDDYCNIQYIINMSKNIVIHDSSIIEPTLSIKMPSIRVGSQVVTDRELISGSYKVENRRVVYSVNLGDYDDFPIPPILDDCSYFLITDSAKVFNDTPWRIISPTFSEVDVKRQCLWYKTHPHWMFPDADFVTWIDSNVECLPHSDKIITSHEALSEIATFVHPDRNCVYAEAEILKKLRLDNEEAINSILEKMKNENFPYNNGLYETNVLFSRVHDLGVREFFDTWWRHICLGSRRDQMSFTFSAWKEKIAISELDSRFCAKNSRFFRKRKHKSKHERYI